MMAFHALRGTRRVLMRARAPVKHSGGSFWLWWLLMGAGCLRSHCSRDPGRTAEEIITELIAAIVAARADGDGVLNHCGCARPP